MLKSNWYSIFFFLDISDFYNEFDILHTVFIKLHCTGILSLEDSKFKAGLKYFKGLYDDTLEA